MKKYLMKTACLLFALLFCLSFTACKDNTESDCITFDTKYLNETGSILFHADGTGYYEYDGTSYYDYATINTVIYWRESAPGLVYIFPQVENKGKRVLPFPAGAPLYVTKDFLTVCYPGGDGKAIVLPYYREGYTPDAAE